MAALVPLESALDAIARRLRSARSLRVASDFDGTLAPLANRPARAVLSPRARRALRRLAARPGVRVAVLSGRSLADLRRKVGLAGVFLAGSGGLETLDPRGRRRIHLARDQRLPRALREALRAWCEEFRGAWLEDKGLVLALHYRALAPRRRAAFSAGVRRRFAPYADRARILPARLAFEVLPGRSHDKADALRLWLGRERAGALFYFGDDTNDEPVQRLVAKRGGFAVAVGRPVRGARYRLAGPRQVAPFLEWLERAWAPAARKGSVRAVAAAARKGSVRAVAARGPLRRSPPPRSRPRG